MKSGSDRTVKKAHRKHLNDRDLQILEFVNRYRVGTVKLLAHDVFGTTDNLKNVRRVLRRLERRGLVEKESWDNGLFYFVLTPQGCRVLELSPRTSRPLTEQSLPAVLAVAFHCVRRGEERMTCQEFMKLYPELWKPGLRSSSYVLAETQDGLKLELLLVDRGGAARRIRSRVRRAITQRNGLSEFASLMEVGRFRINFLTGTNEQRCKIVRQIEKESFKPVEVCATVVPELAEILLLRK